MLFKIADAWYYSSSPCRDLLCHKNCYCWLVDNNFQTLPAIRYGKPLNPFLLFCKYGLRLILRENTKYSKVDAVTFECLCAHPCVSRLHWHLLLAHLAVVVVSFISEPSKYIKHNNIGFHVQTDTEKEEATKRSTLQHASENETWRWGD